MYQYLTHVLSTWVSQEQALNGYSTDVYENVTLVSNTLTYDIKATAPSGTHDINIQRECATLS